MTIDPPRFDDGAGYGEHLGDAGFWQPYVREVLDRHGLGERVLESGFVGTYPTFLAGDVVVKLFGCLPGWESSFRTERSVHARLAGRPEVPAPRVLAHGSLFGEVKEPWPYLVSERVPGVAWRDATLTPEQVRGLAHQLGQVMRVVHDLAPAEAWPSADDDLDVPGDWAAAHAEEVVSRQRARGRLDERLIAEIPAYVSSLPDPSERRLIHADLTRDHVFVADGRLAGIIDWGDTMIADRYYELAALHLDLFARDTSALRAFLEGCGWHPPADFEHRALGLALLHQFDVLAGTPTNHDSLQAMAFELFGLDH